MIKKEFKKSLQKATRTIWRALPMMIGMLALVNLANIFSDSFYQSIFTGDYFLDPLIGALAGSISFGMPLNSYIIGGELLNKGVGLLAVATFIFTWSSVGLIMLPLEISYLGKKFALLRNGLNFISAIIVAILTIITLNII